MYLWRLLHISANPYIKAGLQSFQMFSLCVSLSPTWACGGPNRGPHRVDASLLGFCFFLYIPANIRSHLVFETMLVDTPDLFHGQMSLEWLPSCAICYPYPGARAGRGIADDCCFPACLAGWPRRPRAEGKLCLLRWWRCSFLTRIRRPYPITFESFNTNCVWSCILFCSSSSVRVDSVHAQTKMKIHLIKAAKLTVNTLASLNERKDNKELVDTHKPHQ